MAAILVAMRERTVVDTSSVMAVQVSVAMVVVAVALSATAAIVAIVEDMVAAIVIVAALVEGGSRSSAWR